MAKKFLSEIDLDSNKAINVADPTNDQDAATKKYVDDNAGGGPATQIAPIEVTVTTAAGTVAKVGTTTSGDYTPTKGDILLVTFAPSNLANGATLNIDGSGAQSIRLGGLSATAVALAGSKVLMWYDGTAYQLLGSQRRIDENTTYTGITATISAVSSSSTSLFSDRLYIVQYPTAQALLYLPSTAATGSVIQILSRPQNTEGFRIVASSGDNIIMEDGSDSGSGGWIEMGQYGWVELRCSQSSTTWTVTSSSGVVTNNNGDTTGTLEDYGVTATVTELNYVDGVTSAIQTQLDNKYAPTNIVGSVSESSGVPTGAIIESGSNANGSYTKWADGTMICRQTGTISSVEISAASGALYRSDTVTWSYPQAFVGTPSVSWTGRWGTGVGWFALATVSSSSAGGYYIDTVSKGAGTVSIHATAIGRWF